MRFKKYLDEWKIVKSYAGRGVAKMYLDEDVILWYYMIKPTSKGLIYTKPDGKTYLNDKYLTMINIPIKQLTHKKMLAEIYNKIGLDKYLKGDLRDNISDLEEMNPRGRIIKNEIFVYPQSNEVTNKMIEKAINSIYKYIEETNEIS